MTVPKSDEAVVFFGSNIVIAANTYLAEWSNNTETEANLSNDTQFPSSLSFRILYENGSGVNRISCSLRSKNTDKKLVFDCSPLKGRVLKKKLAAGGFCSNTKKTFTAREMGGFYECVVPAVEERK
jgi:hypothetical protein